MDSFYKEEELRGLGFKYIGKNVKVSKHAIIYNHDQIEIGDYSRIDDLCILSGKIKIGKFVHVAVCTRLSGSKAGITINDFSGVAYNSTIIANSDDYTGEFLHNPEMPMRYKKQTAEPVVLERHSLIASHCLIVPGVTIGEGTAVGAMSLVLKSTEKWSMYVGIPAKKIKERKKNILDLEQQLIEELAKGTLFN